jgi:hypothetical protein
MITGTGPPFTGGVEEPLSPPEGVEELLPPPPQPDINVTNNKTRIIFSCNNFFIFKTPRRCYGS